MIDQHEIVDPDDIDIFSYRSIRRAIGYLAISLPILLLSLSFIAFFDTEPQHSISHYYYTNLREIFTGTLCAVGLFLIRYRGHDNASFWKNDKQLTNIAGIMALGVAFFPTTPDCPSQKIYTLIPYNANWLGGLHYGFAAVLFLILALLAINVFTIGQNNQANVPKSMIDENNIYRFCGYSILVFIVAIPFELFDYATLVFEALSLFVFGIAWLVKGRALGQVLKKELYRENVTSERVFEE